MGFLDFITKIFGNKSQRDLKEITPIVDKIKEQYEQVKALSHDQLRERTAQIRQSIQDEVKPERQQIQELKKGIYELDLS